MCILASSINSKCQAEGYIVTFVRRKSIPYMYVRGNKNEFIDQNKELCPDYYDPHMY